MFNMSDRKYVNEQSFIGHTALYYSKTRARIRSSNIYTHTHTCSLNTHTDIPTELN